eukprot:snap_masked-scaffold_2-processed-gene-2.17-mRNA-1 protein AED:1.00 eAED:1.00 QI:0/0/0/0/1/1/3/0/83
MGLKYVNLTPEGYENPPVGQGNLGNLDAEPGVYYRLNLNTVNIIDRALLRALYYKIQLLGLFSERYLTKRILYESWRGDVENI